MNRRGPVLVTLVAMLVAAAGLGPAYAVLDTPVVADLDASTPGLVTGSVTSAAPYVTVRLAADDALEVVTLTEGSGTFELDTWGYGGTLPVLVASCDDAELVTCSEETASAATFVPTDVVPVPTWPTDTDIGPGDDPTVTVADPDGGGDLRAIWVVDGNDVVGTPITRDVETSLALTDGSGFVRLVRCRTGSTEVCTPFSPDQTVDLEVNTELSATVGTVDDLSEANPSSDVVVDTDATGDYELSWSLEQDGNPITAGSGSDSGTLDGNGAAEPFALTGGALPVGSYDVLVTITVTDPVFGVFPATPATGTVTVTSGGPTVTAAVAPIGKVTQSAPTRTVTVDTDVTGDYVLTWSLEQDGTPVPDVGGTPSGSLDTDGAATFSVGAGLEDGDYEVIASIVVTEPGIGTYPAAEATGTVTVDRSGPPVTLSRSVGTIYPLIASSTFPALTQITVTGDTSEVTGYVVVSPSTKVIRNLAPAVPLVWNGRNNSGTVAYNGTYQIYAIDADGNRSAGSTAVTVSRQTLVLKSYSKTISANGSMYDKYVGRCSTLRVPSKRGTWGSLGYYANTRCGTQTFAVSAVSTAHAIKVPTAAKYLDMRVSATGGAASGYAGSKGILRYLTAAGQWRNETVMPSSYGVHRGPTRSLAGMLDANRFLIWGFLTAYGDRYDVIRYTVVIRYYVLS